ncbi:MAG: hypothetical protein K2L84_00630, partial [Muribaculaceae bacterium]|nr:hypothetical protein [Muribaculaceae bacterium]
MAGKHYRGRMGNGRVDVTASEEVTSAAHKDYRIKFKAEFDLYKKGNGRTQMKSAQEKDGYVLGGYDLRDVESIEELQPDGSYREIYRATESATEAAQSKYDRTVPATAEAQRSAISRIIDFAKSVKNRVERAVIGGITPRQAKDFAENGIDVDETWVHSFESSAVAHNQKHHGAEKREDQRGQIAITTEDYARIPDILESYDKISKSPNKTKGTENEVIIYEKEFEDGYVYYLEEKRDNRKSLSFHTMYKKKKGTDSSDGFAVESTAPITPLATPDNLSSNSDGKVSDSAADKQTDGSESSDFERGLADFARRYGAGKERVSVLDREFSEWMSGRSVEELADLDVNMLNAVCNAAGLDAGKAWAFRMSIDKATPKEKLSEVFELRGQRKAGEKWYDLITSHPTFDIERRRDSEGTEYYVIRLKKGFKEREAWKVVAEKHGGIYSGGEGRGVFLFYNGRDAMDAFLREVNANKRGSAEENPRMDPDNAEGGRAASAEAGEVPKGMLEADGDVRFHTETSGDSRGDSEVYEAAKGLLESAGIEVIEVDNATAQEKLGGHGDVRLMGSRTDRKMSQVGEYYSGKELDVNQQSVVDVFSGKEDNVAVDVERAEGTARVIMRQGTENRAGAKHSLFRHFGTRAAWVTEADIAMIPEIIGKGERSVVGKKISYDYVAEDGSRLRVTTEKHGESEVFTNFLSDRKPLQEKSVKDTQLSARRSDAEVSDAKLSNNSESGKSDDSVRVLRTSGGVVYGWTVGGKVYLNRDAMNPETPLHEYTHLWDDMVRRENPELWARGKELMK